MSWIKYSFQIKEGLELVVGMRSAPTEENRFFFYFFFYLSSWWLYSQLVVLYSLGFCLCLTQTSSHKHTPTCSWICAFITYILLFPSLSVSLFLLHHSSIPWWILQRKGVQSLSPRQHKPFICIAEIRGRHFYQPAAPPQCHPILVYPTAGPCPRHHYLRTSSMALLPDPQSLSRHIQIAFVFRTLTWQLCQLQPGSAVVKHVRRFASQSELSEPPLRPPL